jgi:hypothetical protein
MPVREIGVGATPRVDLSDFEFHTTGWPDEVRRSISSTNPIRAFNAAVLLLPRVHVVSFGAATECVPELPLFRMGFGAAKRTLEALGHPYTGFCAAFTETLAAGIVVDSFGEYPDSNPGPEECTYEIATWGAA